MGRFPGGFGEVDESTQRVIFCFLSPERAGWLAGWDLRPEMSAWWVAWRGSTVVTFFERCKKNE